MFRIGETVRVNAEVVPWHDVALGNVEAVTHNCLKNTNVYIVKLKGSNDLVKCIEDMLSPVEDENVEGPGERKSPETITISREDFLRAYDKVDRGGIVYDYFGGDIIAGFKIAHAFVALFFALEKELFGDKAEND